MATTNPALQPTVNFKAVDGLTNGTSWLLGPDRLVTWAIADAGANDFAWSAFGAQLMRDAAGTALQAFAEVANIRFQYQGWFNNVTTAQADIVVTATLAPARYSMTSSTYARAYFPNEAMSDSEIARAYGSSSVYPNASGDVILNFTNGEIANSAFTRGSNGYFALLHELGHALGLKHPHDNGGTPGRPTFAQMGISPADTQRLTIMSYDPATPLAEWFQALGVPTSYGYPQTLMPFDVLALQRIYGPNLTTRTGDNTYQVFNDNAITTTWDAGGRDVVTASGSAFGWRIEGIDGDASQTLVLARPYNSNGITGKFYFNIEDLVGSDYGDTLIGTSANNGLIGQGGNDWLTGGGGNDGIIGGGGLDIASYAGRRAGFTVERYAEGWGVIDRVGSQGGDYVESVERLAFDDRWVALDVDGQGHAAQTAQILRAIFGPGASGDQVSMGIGMYLLDSGVSYTELTSLAIGTPAFLSLAGSRSDTDFVRTVYRNVVGEFPSSSDLAGFVGLLTSGQFTQATLGAYAASAQVNLSSAELVGLVQFGADFIPYAG